MKNYRKAILENKLAEEETKKMLKDYAKDFSSRVQQYDIAHPSVMYAEQEPVLPIKEAEKQFEEELLKQANEMVAKYSIPEYGGRFAKTKQYLNKL